MRMNAPYGIKYLNGLFGGTGSVGYGARSVIHTDKYDPYWSMDQLKGADEWLTEKTSKVDVAHVYTDATIDHMLNIVANTLSQTQQIAEHLQGATLQATLRNIHDYFLNHYQYKKDNDHFEELRSPVRAYANRYTGIDCDCFAISISSILSNLGIGHYIRRTKYDPTEQDYTHVYIVVPKEDTLSSRTDYYVVDPVIHQFNYEWPENQKPIYKKDTAVMPTALGAILSIFNTDSSGSVQNLLDSGKVVEGDDVKTNILSNFNDTVDQAVNTFNTGVETTSLNPIIPEERNAGGGERAPITTEPVEQTITTVDPQIQTTQVQPTQNQQSKASILGDNPARTIIMIGSGLVLASLLINDNEHEIDPPSMDGPGDNKKKSGRNTGSKKTTIKVKL